MLLLLLVGPGGEAATTAEADMQVQERAFSVLLSNRAFAGAGLARAFNGEVKDRDFTNAVQRRSFSGVAKDR